MQVFARIYLIDLFLKRLRKKHRRIVQSLPHISHIDKIPAFCRQQR